MIHIKDLSQIHTRKYIWIWLLSAFKAGFINSAGFLATGKFVSHVTGFGTNIGIAFGHEMFFFGAELLIIPIAFISGGVITSAILDRDQDSPPYHLVQGLISLLIVVVILVGETSFSDRQIPFDVDENYNTLEFVIIGLLCLICGLKNSLVTWTTHGKIRISHLTGLSTDIGLHFLRSIGKGNPRASMTEAPRVNFIRIATFFSFSTGAFMSAVLFPRFGFHVFFFVLAISIFMTALAIHDRRAHRAKANHREPLSPLGAAFEMREQPIAAVVGSPEKNQIKSNE
jgi:uncharacterized membrane protein YoaK (UPF0700 family)